MTLACYYLPPVSWFAALVQSGERELVLNLEEGYRKQSLRNRCYIDSPNGRLALTVPVDRSSMKGRMADVRLSGQLDWRHQHWAALETSYYNSAFFEFLGDEFKAVYEREWESLAELNVELIKCCIRALDLDIEVKIGGGKSAEYDLKRTEYYQVFAQKHGFLEDLSIIDLIFNLGGEAPCFLMSC